MPPRQSARTALALAAALFLAACGSKVSLENFERIQTGMTQKEVVAILGEPTETSAISIAGVSGGMANWQDGATRHLRAVRQRQGAGQAAEPGSGAAAGQVGAARRRAARAAARPGSAYSPSSSFACAAASRAIGTRGPEQDT